MDRFAVVFGRFKPFWIVWERFGHPGLPNQTSKIQIRQPYFREPPLEAISFGFGQQWIASDSIDDLIAHCHGVVESLSLKDGF